MLSSEIFLVHFQMAGYWQTISLYCLIISVKFKNTHCSAAPDSVCIDNKWQ